MVDQAEMEGSGQDLMTVVQAVVLLKCTRQLVTIAEKNARFLLDQQAASLYFAAVVLKTKEIPIQEDPEEEIFPPKADHPLDGKIDRCLKLPVMSVKTTVKFLFSQAEISLSTVVIVSERKRE